MFNKLMRSLNMNGSRIDTIANKAEVLLANNRKYIMKCGISLKISLRTYMKSNRNILKLHDRGIFCDMFPAERSPDLLHALVGSPQCVYCGFDPTASSLHVGNLLPLLALLHCQRSGHQPIALLGGATAQIGDPSGKTSERRAMSYDIIQGNVSDLTRSLKKIFYNHKKYFWKEEKELQPVLILDNSEWYASRNVIEFLSTVGRHFRMGTMLLKDSVKTRLKSTEGMSLTEFSYQVFQAYDWLHLYRNYNCLIQVGGNDQMGNIVAGHELISRITKKPVFGLTVPLVTTAGGIKLGKTEGNAVWLNSEKTSPFHLYQYFLRLPDDEVDMMLRLFTFLPDQEIHHIVEKHLRNPEKRKGQQVVAENVTLLVHGEQGLDAANRCTKALYQMSTESLAQLSQRELEDVFTNTSTHKLFLDPGMTIYDVAMAIKLFERGVDAERVIKAGGLYINHHRVTEPESVLLLGQHVLPNNLTLIRKGKKNYHLVQWMT